jgi:hypothetical protein
MPEKAGFAGTCANAKKAMHFQSPLQPSRAVGSIAQGRASDKMIAQR